MNQAESEHQTNKKGYWRLRITFSQEKEDWELQKWKPFVRKGQRLRGESLVSLWVWRCE